MEIKLLVFVYLWFEACSKNNKWKNRRY